MVITCEPDAADTAADETACVGDAAAVDAVASWLGVSVGVSDGAALVAGATDVLPAALTTAAVLDEVPAADPSAVFRAPSGPTLVSQSAADTAARTATTENSAARGTLRRRGGLRLLRSMNRSVAISL
jgi:hypothetical protein